jgi:serine phosphatase RsbU (regulator of sigma subunit)
MTWYLASDGFLDQAGGDHGYGYGRRRFRKLVTRLASLAADEQLEELNREFTAWSGDLPQRDDVTILAFRTGAVS